MRERVAGIKPGMKAMESYLFYPLTPVRWDDFEALFGESGAYGGCWCMWWRCKRKEFESQSGDGNRQAMKALVESGEVPGILAYFGERPVGWCSIAPRSQYGALERSPVLKRIDGQPVWSIVCFYVARDFRQRGLMGALIDAAVAYAEDQGAQIVEGYPTIPRNSKLAPASSFMGLPQVFFAHGFSLVGEPSRSRLIVRKYIK